MNASCTKCGTNLKLPWSFCPHCGLAIAHEPHSETAPVEHRRSTMPGAFGGLLFGIIITPVLIIMGSLLCLTGLGAVLGIPIIILAILAPLAGPLFGMGEHKGKCPSCGRVVITVSDGQLHSCPACNREFSLDDHGLVRAG